MGKKLLRERESLKVEKRERESERIYGDREGECKERREREREVG